MPLYYLDSSAIVKIIWREPETDALRDFLAGAALVSSELAVAEIPRAVRRAAADAGSRVIRSLIARTSEALDEIALVALDRALLELAGAFSEPSLCALDAIHLASAIDVGPVDGFVTYDERQSAAARLAGLTSLTPGHAP